MNKDDEMVLYQQVVGFLMYAMLCIWLNLAYPISMVNPSLEIGLWSNAFFDICKVPCNSNYNLEKYCCNLSLELTTKAKGLQGCGQDQARESHFHAPESAKECEGKNPHTPKWTPMLGVGVPVDSWMFRKWLQRSKPNVSKSFSYHWKAIKT